jgi:predicted transcriptional regulator
LFEIETHEEVREKLQRIIKERDITITDLRETLSIPRQHFKFIERLTTEEILKQKQEILTNMAAEMGIPAETLISKMYHKEAVKQAKA